MIDSPVFRYESKLARELAALVGIRQDLTEAKRLVLAHVNPAQKDLSRATYIAALIIYRRCFKDSKRAKLNILKLHGIFGAQEYHNHWINMADKHVAHSVNSFEQIAIGAITNESQIVGVAKLSMNRVGESEKSMEDFAYFIESIIQKVVMPMIENLEKSILQEMRARNFDEIAACELLSITVPSSVETSVPRSKN